MNFKFLDELCAPSGSILVIHRDVEIGNKNENLSLAMNFENEDLSKIHSGICCNSVKSQMNFRETESSL